LNQTKNEKGLPLVSLSQWQVEKSKILNLGQKFRIKTEDSLTSRSSSQIGFRHKRMLVPAQKARQKHSLPLQQNCLQLSLSIGCAGGGHAVFAENIFLVSLSKPSHPRR